MQRDIQVWRREPAGSGEVCVSEVNMSAIFRVTGRSLRQRLHNFKWEFPEHFRHEVGSSR